jgi:bifunctional enzyme CysN/CysC
MTGPRSPNVRWHGGRVSREDRPAASTVWITGLPASGKSTVAHAAEAALVAGGRPAYVLDGDNLRHGLNGDLGFSPQDRAENVRRLAHVARLFADAGVVALVSAVSPVAADREAARAVHEEAGLGFVEVFVDTPLEECERRDPKGLYARARAGEIPDMTGVGAPFDAPGSPELRITPDMDAEEAAAAIAGLVGG